MLSASDVSASLTHDLVFAIFVSSALMEERAREITNRLKGMAKISPLIRKGAMT